MPIPVDCACGRTINAPDAMAGKTARCTYCGKPIPVPAPAAAAPKPDPGPTISVKCACGKSLKAPASMAGKSAKCPGCGAVLAVPAAAVEVVTLAPPAEEAPEALPEPDARRRRKPRETPLSARPADLPVPALALAIVGLLDAVAAGFLGVLLILASWLAGKGAEIVEASQAEAQARLAPVEAAIQRIRDEGGNVTLNMRGESRDGRPIQRIEYTTKSGEKQALIVELDEAFVPVLSEEKMKNVRKAASLARLIGVMGALLVLVALGKLACGTGLLLRRNWGRAGLVALAAIQSVLILSGVLTGGAGPIALASLLVNAAIFLYFLAPSVRAATYR